VPTEQKAGKASQSRLGNLVLPRPQFRFFDSGRFVVLGFRTLRCACWFVRLVMTRGGLLEHAGMALPLSLWRRESDLLLLTVRAPDKRASSRLVRVLDSALLPASVALVSRELHSRTDQQYHGRNRARVSLFVASEPPLEPALKVQ
jgi:hypothetical protein